MTIIHGIGVATDTTTCPAEREASQLLTVRMVSGRLVDLLDPDPASIRVEDLAHALARVCRFTGNVTEWWSVADHALLCRELICEAGASELAVAALHHDSHEAIVGDIITPVRELLGPDRVHALTRRLDEAIAAALGLDVELLWQPLVTDVDRAAAHLEADALQAAPRICSAPLRTCASRHVRCAATAGRSPRGASFRPTGGSAALNRTVTVTDEHHAAARAARAARPHTHPRRRRRGALPARTRPVRATARPAGLRRDLS